LAAAKGVVLRRKAERRGRTIDTLDIGEVVEEVLGPLRKRLSREAELELKQRLGDDLRLLANELAKLAIYAGDRALIGRDDVEAIVAPVREDEFFAVSEAVQEGDLGRGLSLLHDELRRTQNATSVALPFRAEGDFALKTGADPRLLTERLLTQICGAR